MSDDILIDPDELQEELESNQETLQDIGGDVMHLAKQIKKTQRELQKVKEDIGEAETECSAKA